MKKFLLFIVSFVFIFGISFFQINTFADCSYDGGLSSSLDSCFQNSKLVKADDLRVDKGLQEKLLTWKNRLAFYLGIAAVFSIAFSGFIMTISAGNEEKINKAKTVFNWSIAGFLIIVLGATIITVIVKLFYSI
ncbi:hypothetical protein DLH72_02770 [Candidatus Gracilibacteria bacterium]|nr:MAG: hypothetical protein DLH72_02770 [Candidatus Gracilibacteria bacterium]